MLGLGCAPLGALEGAEGERAAIETVQYAVEHGCTLVDVAPFYGAGRSERYVGAALAGVPRDSFVLTTKVGRLVSADGDVSFDFSRDGVLRSVEDSLQRLGLDHVDVLHTHDPDDHYEQALNEAYPALSDLRDQGVVKGVGAGMNQWEMERQFAGNADFNCFLLAGRYTLLEQTPLDTFFPQCLENNNGLVLGGVYNSGVLASGARADAQYNYAPAPPSVLDRVSRIEAICERHGVALNVAALQFAAAHPAVSSLVVGGVSPQEVEANIAARSIPIPEALWGDLKLERLIASNAPTPTRS